MNLEITRRGLMLVLSSPSGAGKTSICKKLLEQEKELTLSVSATTRTRRPGEVEGADYQFISTPEFETRINKAQFLEYAKVFGHYYGTPSHLVENSLQLGGNVLFDIDWQGFQQLKQNEFDVVGIFILPPSKKELARRLDNRGRDTKEEVVNRMKLAQSEISHFLEYDYIVVNEKLEESVKNILSIIESERHKRDRIINLTKFIDKFRF